MERWWRFPGFHLGLLATNQKILVRIVPRLATNFLVRGGTELWIAWPHATNDWARDIMRLTLRTMLAFLDHVLVGPDAAELGQKIEDSKFASDLVHRIRSSVRHVRLGAPKLDGKGMGADANTVAEYLDNTMPAERFPEFEKVCLESDVQLAEVAACHQVLTIVLEEPVAVEPATRERMYRLGHPELAVQEGEAQLRGSVLSGGSPVPSSPPTGGNGASIPHEDSSATGNRGREVEPVRPAAAEAAKSGTRTRSAAIPESPRAASSPLNLLLGAGAVVAVAFLVTFVALRAIHPLNAEHPVWRVLGGGGAKQFAGNLPTAKPDAVEDAEANGATGARHEEGVAAAGGAAAGGAAAGTTAAEPQKEERVAENRPVAEGKDGGEEEPRIGSGEPPTTPVVSPPMGTPMPNGGESVEMQRGGEPAQTAVLPTGPVAVETPGAGPARKPVVEGVEGKPAEAGAPVHVARYISEEQILSRLDPEKNAWMVLGPDQSLLAGEQLLSLPTFRPQLLLVPSVKMTLAGESFVQLRVPDAAAVPSLAVDFGRLLLVPVGEMGGQLKLDLAGRSGWLSFADLESAVAVEVRPYLAPGADPRATTPTIVVQMWALSGGVRWQEGEQPPVTLVAGQKGVFVDESPWTVVPRDVAPDWVEGRNLSDIERRASQELRRFLTTDRPLALSLMEQTTYRQVEVRALACRCLCYLDIFEPAIRALGDEQQRSYWPAQLTAIQATLPFGEATIEKLRGDLDRVHGGDAESVWRLLWGYSPDQLAMGGGAELVSQLENPLMAVRVLAFLTLYRITDKTQLFRPEESPEHEKPRLMRWRKMLEDGQIVYKVPPSALPPVVPAAPDESAP